MDDARVSGASYQVTLTEILSLALLVVLVVVGADWIVAQMRKGDRDEDE